MSRSELLRKVPLFAGFADDELSALAPCLGQRTFGRGMVLFHKGSPGNSLYLVESGMVRIFILSETGQDITINTHGPGECFGELALLDGLPRSAGAAALEKTVTYVLQRDDFLKTLESNPAMIRPILVLLSARVRHATAYAESLAFLDVQSRTAAALITLAGQHGVTSDNDPDHGTEIDLRLTQAHLASYIAATRESVNRALGTLRDQGIITVSGSTITVIDPEGLRRSVNY